MTIWFVAAGALLVGLVPLWVVILRADTMSRLVAFEVFGVMGALTLVCLAEAFDRSIYADLGVILATLSIVSGLTFARFLERWL